MPTSYDSELAKKLNLKSGMTVRLVARPDDVALDGLSTTTSPAADGVIVFVRTLEEVNARAAVVVEAASAGKVTWMVYPKARQLGTDLNRDILWQAMRVHGAEANRQISIDDTWSAMRFKGSGRAA